MSKRGLKVMIFVVLGAMVSWGAGAWAATPDADHPFNGNADDESGNGRDGAVHGATLCPDRCGDADSAYCFDGDDYIVVDDPPVVTTAATFMAWVWVEDVSGRDGGCVIKKGVYLQRAPYWLAVAEDLKPWACVHVGGAEYNAISSEALSFGEWTHIAGVYDGSGPGLTVYVNGVNRGHQAVTGALDENSAALYFGCDLGNSLVTWEGGIDQVRIYDEALTEGEIQELISLYVDDDAPSDPGPGDPTVSDPLEDGSPMNPFDSIQEAIDAVCDGGTIKVAEGTYFENLVIDGKSLYIEGGWNGTFTERDWDVHVATIDGNQADSCVRYLDCLGGEISGFSITNGLVEAPAPSEPYAGGGGIRCTSSSLIIADNIITGNVVRNLSQVDFAYGGGICLYDASSAVVRNNTINNNSAWLGGGIWCDASSNISIEGNTIDSNRSVAGPGVTVHNATAVTVTGNCITNNEGDSAGGGVYWHNSGGGSIRNNLIANNTLTVGAAYGGGGIYCKYQSVVITNNTIVNNTASGPGGYGGGIYFDAGCSADMTNNIVWDNAADNGHEIYCSGSGSVLNLAYNDILEKDDPASVSSTCTLNWGDGNIDVDPLFANNGDYHLKSEFGRWHSGLGLFVLDEVTSPCIDAGDPDDDFSNETPPRGCHINMGAYGNTAQASLKRVDGDVTGDDQVTILDMIHVRNHLFLCE